MSESIKNETKKTSTLQLTIKISNAEQVETKTIDNIEDFIEFSKEFYEKMKQRGANIEIGAILYATNEKSKLHFETHQIRRLR